MLPIRKSPLSLRTRSGQTIGCFVFPIGAGIESGSSLNPLDMLGLYIVCLNPTVTTRVSLGAGSGRSYNPFARNAANLARLAESEPPAVQPIKARFTHRTFHVAPRGTVCTPITAAIPIRRLPTLSPIKPLPRHLTPGAGNQQNPDNR
jgi:hypothetical protein